MHKLLYCHPYPAWCCQSASTPCLSCVSIVFNFKPPHLHLFLIAAVIKPGGKALSVSNSLVIAMCTKTSKGAAEGADIMDELGFKEEAMKLRGW